MKKPFMWTEDYRHQTLNDIILPKHLKDSFKAIIESGQLQHMLFHGSAGTGKTTCAKILVQDMNLDYKFINASKERNIETLDNTIEQYASTKSMTSPYKVVILDEADNLNPTSTQPAMRSFMERYAENCRFILTCNYKHKILDPIISRCNEIDFNVGKHKGELCFLFLDRICEILDGKEVKYDRSEIGQIILAKAPDWRSILNEIEFLSKSGIINSDAIANSSNANFDKLIGYMKGDSFVKVRKWVVDNLDLPASVIFRGVYDRMSMFKNASRPELILIIANYQEKATRVPDQEINIMACLTEIKMSCEFE